MRNILLVLIGLLFTTELQAQSLNLSDVIRVGLAENFDIQVEEARSEIAVRNNTWGAAGRYPTITLQVASNNRLSDVDNPASFLNGRFSSLGLTGTANVAWTIFDGFRVKITKQRLDQLEALSAGNAALVVENTLQALILQYYACLIEAERLQVQRTNLKLSRDRFAFAETRKEIGSAVSFDVLSAQNAYFADSSAFLLQQLAVDNSLRNLAQLLGYEPGEAVTVAGDLREDFERYDESILAGKMMGNSQTLKNQFINLEILQKDIELSRANRMPTLTANGGATYGSSRFQIQNMEARSGSQLDYYANFSLNFTLYNGGNIKRSIESAEISQRVGMLTIQQMKHSMRYQLMNALAAYETRRELLALSTATVDIASKNEKIAAEKFRQGTINSFNYRDVQQALLQASLARLQAVFNALDAETALLRLTGGILEMANGE